MRALWFSAPIWLGSFAVLVSHSTVPRFDRIMILSFLLFLAVVVAILRFG
jgi:hypothetical protein